MTTTAFFGGRIRTGVPGETVDWVFTRADTIEALGPGEPPEADRTVDLDGAVLVPAFRDGHLHLPATGLYAAGLDFRGVRSSGTILAAFRNRAASDEILFGGNFEEPLDEPITRHELDREVKSRPALLARADMHSCIVSTALLDQLDVESLEGVDLDDDGSPTGYLRERAAAEAWRWFDANLTPQQQRDAVLRAVELAYSKGIAEAHEMFVVEWRGWDSAERFLETIDGVALNVPVYLGTDDVERVRAMGFNRIGGDWFLDGSFGSHTAWMREPFVTPPPGGSPPNGISYRTDDEVYAFFKAAQDAGMQVGVHAIGDAAIDQAIRSWTRVAEDIGGADGVVAVRLLGHRIEHFECANDDHIEAAALLGLKPSVQPAFDRFWGGADGLYASRIGWDRARLMNRFNTMAKAGLQMGGGSDSTVTPLDPFLQMTSLRQHHLPEESLSADLALQVMTVGVANLAPSEGPRGLISEGGWAEFALLDRDPLEIDPDELLKTEVLGTWVRGRRVWPLDEAETP
jgi:predicted amidohydrolase YtcJ